MKEATGLEFYLRVANLVLAGLLFLFSLGAIQFFGFLLLLCILLTPSVLLYIKGKSVYYPLIASIVSMTSILAFLLSAFYFPRFFKTIEMIVAIAIIIAIIIIVLSLVSLVWLLTPDTKSESE